MLGFGGLDRNCLLKSWQIKIWHCTIVWINA